MQTRAFIIACALALSVTCSLRAQQVSHAYCEKDGKAHIVYRDNSEQIVHPQKDQVGCEHLNIADNASTVAWSVLVNNCCTSYPIPMSVVVYRVRRQTVISPGQMVWDWHFVDKGDLLAVLCGPVHGEPGKATLYNAHNGRVVAEWEGKGTPPGWASTWQTNFSQKP